MNTAKFNTSQYLRDWKRLHHSQEQQAYPLFKKALNEQTKTVSDFITHHGIANLSQHLTVLVSKQPMQKAYLQVYQRSGVAGAGFTLNHINKIAKGQKSIDGSNRKELPGFFSEQWRKLMSLFYNTQAATRVQGVTDTTIEQIQQLLDESQDLPISQQATYIQDKLDDPDFNRMRALRIARTETTTAANYGALLGGESSDYETAKSWLAVLDSNTRPDHVDASGQTVGMDEQFEVGSSLMNYPGDMSAPANEVVNCRCSIVIVPLLSESGVPILKVA